MWKWSWKKATYWSLLLSGFSPRPCKFPLFELLQRLFWETWIATLFFSCFKSIYFDHIKTSRSHRFLSNWLTAYYIRETFASNWLRSSSVKRKCLSLCNKGLCDVNSPQQHPLRPFLGARHAVLINKIVLCTSHKLQLKTVSNVYFKSFTRRK